MNLPFPSANTEHPTSEKSLNAKAFQSWRWVFLAVILLAAVTIGAFYFSVVQAQETNGAITGLTLTSDTPGTLTVSWDTASPAPTDYRVDWAKSTEGYKSWKVDEGHVYPAETAKTVTITDLAHDTEYKIRMRARYYKGEHEGKSWGGPWAEESLQVAANTQQEPATPTPEPTPTPAPGTLDEVNSTDDGSGGLVLSWQAPAAPHDQPADYRVNWAKSADEYPSYTQEDANAYPTNSTHTLEGLEYDTEYKIQIRARYYQGEHEDSPWSGPWRETTAQVQQPLPAAPNLTGTPLTPEGQVMLVWQDPSDDSITGYQILRGPDADSLAVIEEDTGSSATIYTDTSPPAGQTHTYAVKARNAAGLSPLSDTVTVTVPPAAPNLTGTPLTPEGQVMLVWQDPSDDSITGYQILRGPDADSLAVIEEDTGSSATIYTDTSPPAGQTHTYAVKARNAAGLSPLSDTVTVTVPPAAPNLTGTPLTPEGQVMLVWQDPSDDSITGYQILRGPDADSLAVIEEDTGSSATIYTDTSPPAGQTHTYAVKARNAAGLSPLSDTVTVTVPPAAPTGLTALPTHDSLMLSWHTPDHDGITGYQVLRGPDADSLAVIEEDTGSSATIYTDTSPPAGQTHTYAVKARNAAGLSPLSDTVTVTVPPAAPTGLTALPTHDSLMLSWHTPDHDGITGYQVLRGPDADSLAVIEEDTGSSATIYTDTSPAAGQTHTYAVKARNAAGLSPLSDTVTVTVPPAAPTGLTALPTHDSLMLSWHTPDHDGITGYQVLRGPDADSLAVIEEDTGSSATIYTDTSPPAGQTHTYAVKARNAAGLSPLSDTVTVTVPPAAPTGLTALPTHDSLMLSWHTPDHDGITGYQILRGPDADSLEVVATDTGSLAPWYVDTDVSEDTSYAYAVKALGAGGESAPSGVVEVSTLQAATITFVGPSVEEDPPIAQQQQEGDPPPSPYHLRLFASHDRVTLRWGSYGCCGNVTGFRILRGPSEDTLEVLVADTGSATPWYVDSAVEAGTGYVYAIKSLNGNGESPESTSRSVTTSSAPGANTLLSNMGAGVTGAPVGDAAFVGSGKAAQAFTTGDNAQGYNLEGVRVDVFRGNDAPIDPKVSLYATNGFRPSTLVYELTPPERDHTLPDTDTRHVRSHEYRRGSEYYTAPAGATLSANTRYLVVFEQGSATDQAYSSSYYTMGNITGEANSGAASGWSIGYSIHIDSGTQIFRTKRQIAIIGSAR